MFYLYKITIGVSCIAFILLLIRVLINKNNLNFKSDKYNWKFFITLLCINIIPIINIAFAMSNAYVSILMNKEKFIKFINE